MTEIQQFQIESSIRLIIIRWLYLFLGVGFIGLTIYLNSKNTEAISFSDGPLIFLFLVFIFINLPFLFLAQYVEAKKNIWGNYFIGFLNLVLDVVLFSSLIYLTLDLIPQVEILFLIPIISGVVLFGFWGAFITSVIVGLTLVLINSNFSLPLSVVQIEPLVIPVVIYFLTSFILSYYHKILKPINIFSSQQKNIKYNLANDEQLQWVRKYGQKMEENNRKLYAKELELKLAKQELEMLDQAKSKFISVTAHQMRTPLAAIKWTFDMLLSKQLGEINEEQKNFLTKGFQSAERIIAIVNSLVQVDQIETKWSEDVDLDKVDLMVLLESVLLEFNNHVASKHINLVIKKPSNKLPLIEADPGKIRMVIENLIDNAIKYTPKGGEVTILVSDEKINSANSSVEISVADSGIGIPTREQSKIFQKFFRATNAVATEPNGSGVGLFIAKEIVDSHNGSLWFESQSGKGTTFYIRLPISQSGKALI